MANKAINAGGLGQRAYGASPTPAGYGERYGLAFAEVGAMSEHHAKVVWSRNEVDFSYQTYSRDHLWSFPGGVEVPASAAPDFLGSEQRVDPEEAFVAALSSCHMLTFLAIAAKKRLVIEEYQDEAVGFLEKNDMGKLKASASQAGTD